PAPCGASSSSSWLIRPWTTTAQTERWSSSSSERTPADEATAWSRCDSIEKELEVSDRRRPIHAAPDHRLGGAFYSQSCRTRVRDESGDSTQALASGPADAEGARRPRAEEASLGVLLQGV